MRHKPVYRPPVELFALGAALWAVLILIVLRLVYF